MAREIRVAELFAGVGGFRLGLDGFDDEKAGIHLPPAGPFHTVWANQWEPMGSPARQFAWRCYERHFGEGSCVNEDIAKVMDACENYELKVPDVDMVVGGFPCQDYSVARPLSQADGIRGKKGVLWWEIRRMLMLQSPEYLLLENVDRLLKSPASQRGRDFAVILACLADLGYSVEWRVVNAADYGMPQRRKRTYIYGVRTSRSWNLRNRLLANGVMTRAFPVEESVRDAAVSEFDIPEDIVEVSETFGKGLERSPFEVAGVMRKGHVLTCRVTPHYDGPRMTLGDVVVPESEVPAEYFLDEGSLPRWTYLKGAKQEDRVSSTGFHYRYTEGGMAFPDGLDKPSRTILTSEGGSGPSRMRHVVRAEDGRLRRLVPDELDQLQMFPKGWTDTGMTPTQRAFCMGNALVVGIPHRIGQVIADDHAHGRQ